MNNVLFKPKQPFEMVVGDLFTDLPKDCHLYILSYTGDRQKAGLWVAINLETGLAYRPPTTTALAAVEGLVSAGKNLTISVE